MRLEKLELYRYSWEKQGALQGKIMFSGEHGEVQINLSEAEIAGILPVVAKAIVAASQEVATKLTASVIEASGMPLLEGQSESGSALPRPGSEASA